MSLMGPDKSLEYIMISNDPFHVPVQQTLKMSVLPGLLPPLSPLPPFLSGQQPDPDLPFFWDPLLVDYPMAPAAAHLIWELFGN